MSQNINDIVEKLFDWNVEDDDFVELLEKFNAQELASAIRNEKKERGWRAYIRVPTEYHEAQVEALIGKLEEMRTSLDAKEFKETWGSFLFTNEFSVWGGSTWSPKILYNGGLAIRNHHRVIALDESPVGSFNADNSKIHSDLSIIIPHLNDIGKDGDTWSFGILHNGEEGAVWTNKLPTQLSDYGQTLIFITQDVIETLTENEIINDDSFLHEDSIAEAIQNSRSGHAVLRVFKDIVFVYSTHRASDDYDTILEAHSNYLGDGDYDEDTFTIRIEPNSFKVVELIKDDLESTELAIFSYPVLADKEELRKLIEDKLYTEYAQEKANQISQFIPIFTNATDRPATYYNNIIPLFDASREYGLKTYNMLMSASVAKSFETFEDDIRNAIYEASEVVSPEELKVAIGGPDNQDFNIISVFEVDSPEFKSALDEMKTSLIESYVESYECEIGEDEDQEAEFFSDSGYENQFSVMFIFEENIEILDAHANALRVSQTLESSLSLVVPAIGLYQGYCEGELDTGNNLVFLTQDELDSVEIDEDDWD